MKSRWAIIAVLLCVTAAPALSAQFPRPPAPPPAPPPPPPPPAPPTPPPVTLSVHRVHVAGKGSAETFPDTSGVLIVRGENVGFAGVTVSRDQSDFSVSIAPPRPDLAPDCIAPACTFLNFSVGNVPTGVRSFTLRSPTGHTAQGRFQIQPTPQAAASPRPVAGGSSPVMGGAQPPIGVGQTPAPPAPRQVHATAFRPCPVTAAQRPGHNPNPTPSEVFEVLGAPVQATAVMSPLNTTIGMGSERRPLCTWEGPLQWRIEAVNGGTTVAVQGPGGHVVTLQPGRYQIRPDASFPADYQYVVRFTQ